MILLKQRTEEFKFAAHNCQTLASNPLVQSSSLSKTPRLILSMPLWYFPKYLHCADSIGHDTEKMGTTTNNLLPAGFKTYITNLITNLHIGLKSTKDSAKCYRWHRSCPTWWAPPWETPSKSKQHTNWGKGTGLVIVTVWLSSLPIFSTFGWPTIERRNTWHQYACPSSDTSDSSPSQIINIFWAFDYHITNSTSGKCYYAIIWLDARRIYSTWRAYIW